ncbi:MAG: CehA/McbA family metallohydrolase [Bacteroidetes bacterium]|nr:CehA/McbA family metallohydrolase [Bacteroidota bacterium]
MKKICFVFIILIYSCGIGFAQSPYIAYKGNLHSHTSLSDGEGTPEEAFIYARDSAHLDFLAVTDHLEQIYLDLLAWFETQGDADNATVNGSYVAMAGYEWGSPQYGHCNVLNTGALLSALTYTDWPAFCQDVVDEYPAIGQFNHPAEEIYFSNWNNFDYMGTVIDSSFNLIEIEDLYQEQWYITALNSGWHLSPVANQDNHSADWGTKNDKRAGIWATDLSRTSLFNAMRSGRTFASWDKNAEIWIDINGHSMGQPVQKDYDMALHIFLDDADNEPWLSVEVITGAGTILSFASSNGLIDTTVYITPESFNWLYVRAGQDDYQFLWSAPVYFTGTLSQVKDRQHVPLTDLKIYPNPAKDEFTLNFNMDS